MSDIVATNALFDQLRHLDSHGVEYWNARELAAPLGYPKWDRFGKVIEKATLACENSGSEAFDHFRGASKMIATGKGAMREVTDYRLTRYGAYLTAMNGDPRKPEIAAAQAYFAAKTREAEVVVPAQDAELEKLRLELELSKSELARNQCQERLLSAAQMLNYHNPGLAALALGKPDAIVEVEKPVTVIVDAYGRPEKYDGVTITELSKRYGFGKGTKANKQCREWIKSMGVDDDQWIDEPAAHVTKKLPREMLSLLDQSFQSGRGERQRLVGE